MIEFVDHVPTERRAKQHQAEQAKANPSARQDNRLFHILHTNPHGEN